MVTLGRRSFRFIPSAASVALLTVTLGSTPVRAQQVVQVPSGWTASTRSFAYADGAVAIALDSGTGVPTRVLQDRGGVQTTTDLTGPILGLEYAAGAQRLLVTVLSAEAQEGAQAAAIDPLGAVVWTVELQGRRAVFSDTGQSLVIYRTHGPQGAEAEIRDAATGAVIRSLAVDVGMAGMAVAGSGDTWVIALGESVIGFSSTPNGVVETWRHEYSTTDDPTSSLSWLAPDRLLVKQWYGAFKIFSAAGQEFYHYDPIALGESDPSHDWEHYAAFAPHPSGTSSTVLLIAKLQESGYVLNIATGFLEPVLLDTSVPPGSQLLSYVKNGRLAIVGPTAVLIVSTPV